VCGESLSDAREGLAQEIHFGGLTEVAQIGPADKNCELPIVPCDPL
jgi:hypothetical protein